MTSSILKGEYKEAYTNIVLYLSSSNIPDDFVSEVSEDVKDLLLNAQNDRMDVKDIIGENVEVFCNEIIKTKKFKNQTLFNAIGSIYYGLLMSSVIALMYYLTNIQMTLNIISMFIIDYLFCTFIFKRGLRKALLKGKGNVKKIIMALLLYILVLIPGAIFNYILLTNYVVEVNSLCTAVALLILTAGIYIIPKALKNRGIRMQNCRR